MDTFADRMHESRKLYNKCTFLPSKEEKSGSVAYCGGCGSLVDEQRCIVFAVSKVAQLKIEGLAQNIIASFVNYYFLSFR